jgi:hypothetical protein
MPEIVADSPAPSCSLLLSESRIQESQPLGTDLSVPRARDVRGRFAKGSSGKPARPSSRHPQSQAAHPRSRLKAAERWGAGGSARPQTASVAGSRRPAFAAAANCHRPGEASRDRPVVDAHGRGCPVGHANRSGSHRARRDLTGRGCRHRAAGAPLVALGPQACTSGFSRQKRGKTASGFLGEGLCCRSGVVARRRH